MLNYGGKDQVDELPLGVCHLWSLGLNSPGFQLQVTLLPVICSVASLPWDKCMPSPWLSLGFKSNN